MNFVAAIVALIPVYYFGRKRIFVIGYGAMAVTLGLAGLFIAFDLYILALIFICFYIAIWQTSAGVITSIYSSEISILSKNSIFPSRGLALAVSYILHIQIALSMEFMMNEWGAHGTVLFFAAFNLVGFIFNLVALKETKGLTEAQKKLVYSPVTTVGESKLKITGKSDAFEFNTKLGSETKFGGQGKMVVERKNKLQR